MTCKTIFNTETNVAFQKDIIIIVVVAAAAVEPCVTEPVVVDVATWNEATDTSDNVGCPWRVTDWESADSIQSEFSGNVVIVAKTGTRTGRMQRHTFKSDTKISGEEIVYCAATTPSVVAKVSASVRCGRRVRAEQIHLDFVCSVEVLNWSGRRDDYVLRTRNRFPCE